MRRRRERRRRERRREGEEDTARKNKKHSPRFGNKYDTSRNIIGIQKYKTCKKTLNNTHCRYNYCSIVFADLLFVSLRVVHICYYDCSYPKNG